MSWWKNFLPSGQRGGGRYTLHDTFLIGAKTKVGSGLHDSLKKKKKKQKKNVGIFQCIEWFFDCFLLYNNCLRTQYRHSVVIKVSIYGKTTTKNTIFL